jgi:uncharacterized membrane protein
VDSVVKYFGIISVLILLLSFASAVTISGPHIVNAGQCETVKQTYTVCVGVSGVYNISATGEASNWMLIAPSGLNIEAGKCGDFYLFVTPECYASAGTFYPQIIVSGPEDTNSSVQLVVNQSHTFDFSLTPSISASNPCVENTFQIYAKNTSKFRDEFVLVQNGLPAGWTNYSQEKIILNPSEGVRAQLKVKSLCNSKPGDYNFSLTFANTMTNTSKKQVVVQTINWFLPVTIGELFSNNAVVEEKSCEEFDKNISFVATNKTDKNDEITISLFDLNYAPLSKDVAYMENGVFSLDVNKPFSVNLIVKKMSPMSVPIILRSHSKNYDLDTDAKLNLVFENCYDLNIIKPVADSNSCLGEKLENFEIVNSGSQSTDVNVFLFDGTTLVETKSVLLEAFSSKTVSFKIDSNVAADKNYSVVAKSIFAQAQTRFNYSFQNCFDAKVTANDVEVCAGTHLKSVIKIFNAGTKDQEFRLNVESNWLFFEQTYVSVKSGETVDVNLSGMVPSDFSEAQLLNIESANEKIQRIINIVYLSDNECNGIEYTAPLVVDANCCAGTIVPVLITNKSSFNHFISFSAIAPEWILLSDSNAFFGAWESKTFYAYLSPPAKSDGNYVAKIILSNDANVSKEANFKVMVFGGNCTPQFDAQLNVSNKSTDLNTESGKVISIDFTIKNDSNVGFNVNEISIMDLNATIDFNQGTFLSAGSSLVAKIIVDSNSGVVPSSKEVTFLVKTSVGDFNKTQKLSFSDSDQSLSITGWFSSFWAPIGGFALLILLMIIVLVLNSRNSKKTPPSPSVKYLQDLKHEQKFSSKKVKSKNK